MSDVAPTPAPSPPARRARGVPEVLSLLAIVGIAWRLWPEAAPPDTLRCERAGAPLDCFVRVPGASFARGAQAADPAGRGHDPAAGPTEGPVVDASVASFWIQRTEAAVGTWRACVKAGRCDAADAGEGGTAYPIAEPDDPQRDALPVNRLSWKGAVDLCASLGGRLPTEAEWELAARGPEGRRWPWGSIERCAMPGGALGFPRLESVGAGLRCDQQAPVRADALPEPTPLGLLGLAGNLWEWTADPWSPEVGGDAVDGADVARAQRGGSFLAESPLELRATVRGGVAPDERLDDVGARCAFGGRP